MIKFTAKSKFSGEEYSGDLISITSLFGTIYYIRPDNSDCQASVVDELGKTWFGIQVIEVDKGSIQEKSK